jgi:hypothetical protein
MLQLHRLSTHLAALIIPDTIEVLVFAKAVQAERILPLGFSVRALVDGFLVVHELERLHPAGCRHRAIQWTTIIGIARRCLGVRSARWRGVLFLRAYYGPLDFSCEFRKRVPARRKG